MNGRDPRKGVGSPMDDPDGGARRVGELGDREGGARRDGELCELDRAGLSRRGGAEGRDGQAQQETRASQECWFHAESHRPGSSYLRSAEVSSILKAVA